MIKNFIKSPNYKILDFKDTPLNKIIKEKVDLEKYNLDKKITENINKEIKKIVIKYDEQNKENNIKEIIYLLNQINYQEESKIEPLNNKNNTKDKENKNLYINKKIVEKAIRLIFNSDIYRSNANILIFINNLVILDLNTLKSNMTPNTNNDLNTNNTNNIFEFNKDNTYTENDLKGREKKERSIQEFLKHKWAIYFPKFDEIYNIKEGVSSQIIDNYCGHFEESEYENGNVSLAGHNRGYRVNSFRYLNKLRKGSIILYKYENNVYLYKVSEIEKISDEDFSKIERKEDILTMITCLENIPDKRLCVTAIPKEWKELRGKNE